MLYLNRSNIYIEEKTIKTMVERKLTAKFYATMKKYSEANNWQKFSRVADKFYTILFNEYKISTNQGERDQLTSKMNDLFLLCQLADIEREKKETREEDPYKEIAKSMTKMHEAFLARNWERALALNDLAYGKGYKLYEEAEGEIKTNLSRRLSFLQDYQDHIISQQLKENKK